MNKIELVNFLDNDSNYKLMYKWCSYEFIYEWFEQRKLSYSEIVDKYQKKLLLGKQKLFIINYNNKAIGYVQIYLYDDILSNYNNFYEYDVFIGEVDYLSKGIGMEIVNYINEYIFKNLLGDGIILRVCKRNVRALKCYWKCGFKIIKEYDDVNTVNEREKYVMLILDSKEVRK